MHPQAHSSLIEIPDEFRQFVTAAFAGSLTGGAAKADRRRWSVHAFLHVRVCTKSRMMRSLSPMTFVRANILSQLYATNGNM